MGTSNIFNFNINNLRVMEYENKFVGLNPIDSDSTNNYSITTTPSDAWYN